MSYLQTQAAYRFVDGYSRRHMAGASRRGAPLSGPSTVLVHGHRDVLVTGGTSRRSYNAKPRFGGGRLATTRATMASARATRFGGGRLGQMDVVGEGIADVASSLLGGGPPDGSSKDPRIIDLNTYYNQAIAGQNTGGMGISGLNAWIADQPPHPTYSNTYARQLLATLQQAQATGATPVPATSNTSPSAPPVLGAPSLFGGSSIAGVPSWMILAGAVVGVVLLAKK